MSFAVKTMQTEKNKVNLCNYLFLCMKQTLLNSQKDKYILEKISFHTLPA